MRVLIAYASRRGGTAGLAAMLGDAFSNLGWEVTVRRAGDVHELGDVDAVVVASALYMNRWLREARRFVARHQEGLRRRPVWLVSSGPLAEEVDTRAPAPRAVRRLMRKVHARSHATFGGRLLRDAQGFPASAMAKSVAGDYRDATQVQAWVDSVVGEISRSS